MDVVKLSIHPASHPFVHLSYYFDGVEKEWNIDCYNKSSSSNRKRQIMSLLKEKETIIRIEKDVVDNKRM
jgi:hypothetical protein